MDKTYNHKDNEDKIYRMWYNGGYFTPEIDPKKKPFTILLPLPNANDPMHMGHALFTVQDVLIRYHRMLGDPALWLPGGDHAGIETQYVFEKKLAREDKSRFDFDRNTLYKMIEEFVEKNKDVNKNQMKRLGFSLDWTRYHYSLEPEIVEIVLATFRKLYKDNLVYRAERLANYCTKCGTAYSDLEIKHVEQKDPLYYMKYGPFVLATVRPETKFGDTAVAVNPKDKRYQKWIGQTIEVDGLLGKFKIKVIADKAIDPKFGTGIAKVTPAHDQTDFEIAQRHNLEKKTIIGINGRLNKLTGPYAGLKVKAARIKVVQDLVTKGLMDHIDENYVHTVSACYKCGSVLEPLLMPQWYVKTKPLAKPAIEAVKKGDTKIAPLLRFKKMYLDWMENILDWNISRQIVWGPRIPVWYCLDCNPDIAISFIDKNSQKVSGTYTELKNKYGFAEIKQGLQSLIALITASYSLNPDVCEKCYGKNILQETDTFDTWFLSSQWPYTTLMSGSSLKFENQNEKLKTNSKLSTINHQLSTTSDFDYFYPTSVLDTMWDILFFWVARMMMMGIYRTGNVPFKTIHLHSRVVDNKGQKMSKSRGNVINPIEMVDKYGADALRFALIFGAAPGSDIVISDDKVRGMRNFCNKLWNICRLFLINFESQNLKPVALPFFENKMLNNVQDKELIKKLNLLIVNTTNNLNKYRFSDAAQEIYTFTWHTFADIYLEENKQRFKDGDMIALSIFRQVLLNILKLLHPFMPFVTEAIWQQLPRKYDKPLIVSQWPKGN